jgi:hypothetical protein
MSSGSPDQGAGRASMCCDDSTCGEFQRHVELFLKSEDAIRRACGSCSNSRWDEELSGERICEAFLGFGGPPRWDRPTAPPPKEECVCQLVRDAKAPAMASEVIAELLVDPRPTASRTGVYIDHEAAVRLRPEQSLRSPTVGSEACPYHRHACRMAQHGEVEERLKGMLAAEHLAPDLLRKTRRAGGRRDACERGARPKRLVPACPRLPRHHVPICTTCSGHIE